ncbi:hypothetical protein BDF19DRAFT_464174 [Syncephalis fuscata]|nr:hypothetical protein BDF19DRAFT_464174 [Syncephalis fuscata]
MKSILAITATALMLVSATQATPVNGMLIYSKILAKPNKGISDEFKSTLDMHNIQLIGEKIIMDNLYYREGKQNGEPIRVACGARSNADNKALRLYKDLMGNHPLHNEDSTISFAIPKTSFFTDKIICYVLPYYDCQKKFEAIAEEFQKNNHKHSDADEDKMLQLWKKIAKGLNYLKKLGWHAHMNIDDICVNQDKSGYKIHFLRFSHSTPVNERINVQSVNRFIIRHTIETIEHNRQLVLISLLDDGTPESKKYDWKDLYAEHGGRIDFNDPSKKVFISDIRNQLNPYKHTINSMLLGPITTNNVS